MSAADKLRALEKRMAIQRGETLYAGHPALEAEKVVRNALPELIGVVETLEYVRKQLHTQRGQPRCNLKKVYGCETCRALAALDAALAPEREP